MASSLGKPSGRLESSVHLSTGRARIEKWLKHQSRTHRPAPMCAISRVYTRAFHYHYFHPGWDDIHPRVVIVICRRWRRRWCRRRRRRYCLPSPPSPLLFHVAIVVRSSWATSSSSSSSRRSPVHDRCGAQHRTKVHRIIRTFRSLRNLQANLISASPFHLLFSVRIPLRHFVKRKKLYDSVGYLMHALSECAHLRLSAACRGASYEI